MRDRYDNFDPNHFRFVRNTGMKWSDFQQPVPRWRVIQRAALWIIVTALIAATLYGRFA